MRVRGIVAMDPAGAIGQNGSLPWHYREDLQFFRRTTLGHTVLMGRRTFESIGRPLAGRTNLVLSSTGFAREGVVTVRSVDEAVQAAAEREGDLFVIGGASVYHAFAERIDEWIVTRIPTTHAGADTFLDAALFHDFRTVRTEQLETLRVEFLQRP